MKKTHKLKILSNNKISDSVFELILDAEELSVEGVTPGSFFNISCGNSGATFLRRPISTGDYDGKKLTLFYEVRGKGTQALSETKESFIDILGPLGHGYEYNGEKKAALVGGGIGIFPLLYLARKLSEKGVEIDAFFGFRNIEAIILADRFEKIPNLTLHICTDDGSTGYYGYPHILFGESAKSTEYGQAYSCGPTPLMKSAAETANQNVIPCQISLEERMGCGIGACLVCSCEINGKQAHVCKDGPVFKVEPL
jgi:dihydroorotate dehydrogenase electron transfer subunit